MIEINPKHPKIDFSKPIQFKARNRGMGSGVYEDCLLSPCGKFLNEGFDGSGSRLEFPWNVLRNTPNVTTAEIVEIRDKAIDFAHNQCGEDLKRNTQRWAAMQYKEKTLP